MSRHQSFVPYRGPVESNPDAGLLPDPWSEPFTVPKASASSWIKGAIGLAIMVALFWAGVHIA